MSDRPSNPFAAQAPGAATAPASGAALPSGSNPFAAQAPGEATAPTSTSGLFAAAAAASDLPSSSNPFAAQGQADASFGAAARAPSSQADLFAQPAQRRSVRGGLPQSSGAGGGLFAAAASDPSCGNPFASGAPAPGAKSSGEGGGLFASGPPKSSGEGGGLFAAAASAAPDPPRGNPFGAPAPGAAQAPTTRAPASFGAAAHADPFATASGGLLASAAPDQPNPFVHQSSEGGPSASGLFAALSAAPPPSAVFGAATPGRPPAAFTPSAGGLFSQSGPLSTKPTAGRSCHVAFDDVCAGESYACAVAPIIAECTDGPAVNDAITLRVHDRGEVTLPKWFVEDFVTMVKPLDEAHLSHRPHDGSISIFVPTEHLDDPPPAFVGPRARGCPVGWTNAGSFDLKSQIAPPTLVGSAQERKTAATADAGLVLRDTGAVPHAVVPKLVTARVVGPFTTKIKCTVAEAFLGVTVLDSVSSQASPSAFPNIATLTLTSFPQTPIPPHTTSLTIRRSQIVKRPLSVMAPCVNSADGLVELTLGADVRALSLKGVPPIPTLKKLTLGKLCGDDAARSIAFLEVVANVTPNVEALAFEERITDDRSVEVALFFFEHHESMWPSATALSIGGLWPAVAVMANARPWRSLSLGWRHSSSLFSTGSASTLSLTDEVKQHIMERSRLLRGHSSERADHSSLEELSIIDSDMKVAEVDGAIHYLPAAAVLNVKALLLPRESISLEQESSSTALHSVFARAEKLTRVRLQDANFGTGFCGSASSLFGQNPTLPFSTDVAAAFGRVFSPTLQRIEIDNWGLQWTRDEMAEGAAMWSSSKWKAPPSAAGAPSCTLVTAASGPHTSPPQITLRPSTH